MTFKNTNEVIFEHSLSTKISKYPPNKNSNFEYFNKTKLSFCVNRVVKYW